MSGPSNDAISSSRAEQRRLKLQEAEQEQLAEELEALKITEEQLNILKQPFRNVKFEFWDLDGLHWTKSSLYTPLYRSSAPVGWHSNTTPSTSTSARSSPAAFGNGLGSFSSPDDYSDTIRYNPITKPRTRKPLQRVYSSTEIQLENTIPMAQPHSTNSPHSPSSHSKTLLAGAAASFGLPPKSRCRNESTGFKHRPPVKNVFSQSTSPDAKGHPMRDLDFNSNFDSPFTASELDPSDTATARNPLGISFGYDLNTKGNNGECYSSLGAASGELYHSPDIPYADMLQDNSASTAFGNGLGSGYDVTPASSCPPSPAPTVTKTFRFTPGY